MNKRYVNVAICQRTIKDSPKDNLRESLELIEKAASKMKDPDIVLLPEVNIGISDNLEQSREIAKEFQGPYLDGMCELAKKLGICIIPGSFYSLTEDGRTGNTTVFIDRNGKILGSYSKIHLFDAFSIKESDRVAPGDTLGVVDTEFGRIGLQICYDLRFPELTRLQVLAGARAIFHMAFFPGGNVLPPRTDHWDGLVNSMAMLNQTWVCSCNAYGDAHGEHPFGRSRIIDPWGMPVAMAGNHEDIICGTLDLDYNETARISTGNLSNRRPDLYEKFRKEYDLH